MAYELVKASSRRVVTSSAMSATGVQTAHLRVKLRSVPANNSFPNRFFCFGPDSDSPYFGLGGTNIFWGFFNGSYREATAATTWNTTDWYSLACVWNFTTTTASLKMFRDGAQIGSTYTIARGTVTTASTQTIGGNTGSGEYSDMHVADFGFWNTELSLAEIAALSKGFPPRRVRPTTLREVRLIRESRDTARGTTVTAVNSPTVATHPRSYP